MKVLVLNLLVISFVLASCTIKEREPTTPTPTVKKVATDFFFEYSADRKTYKSRRFLFGMSSEDLSGARASRRVMDHYNVAGHSNIEFEFNEDGSKLVAKLVDPTYPNTKSKWPTLLTFNISANYYEENAVDPTGRQSKDRIQRSDKSDPRARPFIDIELSSMEIVKNDYSAYWGERKVQKVEEGSIEWGAEGKFLGFTATSIAGEGRKFAQTTDRINLLRFEPGAKDFQETPYNKDNDEFTQVLHIVGTRPNFFGEKLRAVHWDINSDTKKTHVITLHNFPDQYVQIAIDSIEAWNDVFEKVVGYRPFKHEISKRKYAFDLRHHTIHWVDDIALAAAGPLGLGNVAADLTNGKVLWTGSIVWGGMLDSYLNSYIPSTGVSSYHKELRSAQNDISHLVPEWLKKVSPYERINKPSGGSFENEMRNSLQGSLSDFNASLNRQQQLFNQLVADKQSEVDRKYSQGLLTWQEARDIMGRYKLDEEVKNRKTKYSVLSEGELDKLYYEAKRFSKINLELDSALADLRQSPITHVEIQKDLGLIHNFSKSNFVGSGMNKESKLFKNFPEVMKEHYKELPPFMQNSSFDGDFDSQQLFADIQASAQKLGAQGKLVDFVEVKRVSIKETITHEIGHTLGLGHNFMANIMPEKGSVPDKIYKDLHKDAENNMTNTSSIMGYPSGKTTVHTSYDQVKPGPNDVSRIRLLYKQEYPLYDRSLKGKGKYVWTKIKGDGLIPAKVMKNGKVLTPGYLPNCNDTEASFYLDPFCNRHDRGINARTLVAEYFDRYWDVLFNSLESKIDTLKTRDYNRIEQRLWSISSRTFSRTRYFYDYMRDKYKNEIEKLVDKGSIKKTYYKILPFSKSCRELNEVDQTALKNYMKSSNHRSFLSVDSDGQVQINEFGDLCIATSIYFENFKRLLEIEGREFTQIDYLKRRVPGGSRAGGVEHDYAQAFGSWKRISLLPIKIKIMQSMLLPYPTAVTPMGEMPLYPYTRPDTSYSMSTLYPKEYLEVIQSLAKSAMFIDDKESNPRIFRSLAYLGYYLSLQGKTVDYDIVGEEYLKAIFDQTKFRFSEAFIVIDATKVDSVFAKSFSGSIYNRYNNNDSEPLGQIYLYSIGRFIMRSPTNSLVLPISSIRWHTTSKGVSFGVKLDYEPNIHFKELDSFSPREYFIDEYKNVMAQCIEGKDENKVSRGLESFFNNSVGTPFKGIKIPFEIEEGSQTAYEELNSSLETSLDQFRVLSKETGFDLANCERAIKLQRALVYGASLMSGMYFPEIDTILEQGDL